MKILILGGSGFLGTHLTRNLAALGHSISIYHRGTRPVDSLPITSNMIADLSNLSHYSEIIQKMKFDLVIHLAAMSHENAVQAIQIFTGHTERILVASSMDVYAPFGALLHKESRTPDSKPLSESSPLRSSRYLRDNDYEKIDVEETFLENADKLPVTLFRLPPLYGPDDPRHRFFPYLKRFEEKRPAILLDPGSGNFKWSHAYVENAAHALTLAAADPTSKNRIYNLSESPSHKTLTTAERLHLLAAAAKYRGKIIVLPKDLCPPHLLRDLDFRHDLMLDDSLLRKELHYAEIVPIEEALRRTADWQRTVCPLQINHAEFNYPAEDALLADYGLLPTSHKNPNIPTG